MTSTEKKETIILKFKSRKQKRNILIDRKNLRNKSENLSQLKFAGKLFTLFYRLWSRVLKWLVNAFGIISVFL